MLRITRSTLVLVVLAWLALAGSASPAQAQFGKRLKAAVKQAAEDRAIQGTVKTENQAIDGAMSGGKGSAAAADSANPASPAATSAPTAAWPTPSAATCIAPGCWWTAGT